MMTEGNRDKVWRPPKLFTVYQNACKQKTGADRETCQTNFEKVFTCVTAATAITAVPNPCTPGGDPAGCTTGCTTPACTTAPFAANAALNHDKCAFKCDKVAHLSTATYEACVTDAKDAAKLIIATHEVPGKKDDDPYFCCNKQLEESLFNPWQTWDTCQFTEPTTCRPSPILAADGTTVTTAAALTDCKNHYSTALVSPAGPVGSRGISFET